MLPLHGSERCGVGKIADSNNDDRGERGTMEDGHVRSGHSDRGSGRGKFRRWSRFAGSGRSTSSSSEQRRIPGILSRRTSPFALLPLPLPVAGCRLPVAVAVAWRGQRRRGRRRRRRSIGHERRLVQRRRQRQRHRGGRGRGRGAGDWRRIDGCSILRSTSPGRHPDGCHRTTFEMAWGGAAN